MAHESFSDLRIAAIINKYFVYVKVSYLTQERKAFLPRAAVLLHGNDIRIEQVAGFIKPQVMIAGKPTAYFCENYACQEPMTDITKVKELIDQLTGRNVDAESRAITE